ncbi:hypothetical protein [Janthinobacterium agaricidamnosum]|uniref:Uncharacterized protein n=1 Tax=Janthinobacterium agaricidamnosum NBRC 102515 = DSM 9628 TaxID=1349767 RepID=W0V348_9BURK|nr:hypothetical protein [Janthinobacterium agaricidamnosum]CDG82000.1 hypothetical protein GJA_1347 [Janthinobacterium agaricidamnosum NBRC 102515 = DSM 9628]
MTSITSNYVQDNGYFRNLAVAARGLLRALLAAKPYQTLAEKETGAIADERYVRPSQQDIAVLTSEAARYEKMMPNLAAELRFMASRG